MRRPLRTEDADSGAVRLAARRTARQVATTAVVVVVVVFVLAVLFVLDQSRPSELLERAEPGEAKIYVDVREALIALVVLGVLAAAVVAAVGWRVSRRAVEPLGAALRLQRSFVADAGHELRTPLTVLDARVQVLQRQLDRGEPAVETLQALRRDTRAMIELVTDLLLVAEAAAAAPLSGLGVEGADVRPVVAEVVRDLRVLASDHGVTLLEDVRNEARVPLSEPSLRRALLVLVDNAITCTPEGGRVQVLAWTERDRAVLEVLDTGTGIQGIEPGRIFERFAHGSAPGRRRGFGIGLALVHDLAARHGGDVAVTNTSTSGTTIRLTLPMIR